MSNPAEDQSEHQPEPLSSPVLDGPLLLMAIVVLIASGGIAWQVISGAWALGWLIPLLIMVPVGATWLFSARARVELDQRGIGGLLLGRRLSWDKVEGAWIAVGRLVVQPADPGVGSRSRHTLNIMPGHPRGTLVAAVHEEDVELVEAWLSSTGKLREDPIGLR